ncbi:class I SAM-dependent methyltransferase [Lysobacter korlensis]|uniref:Class I SAM-dependent methyltransferase n=1 Tax=Lysobacter korlensis TaxID=553636 RepID=A0ABV6RRD6_9GAMM
MTDSPDPLDKAHERARNFRDAFGGEADLSTYQGIPIFAAPGLHELVARTMLDAVPPGNDVRVRVLELGAGGGALSQRLVDLGYALTASDLFVERFAPREHVPFHPLDLNGVFSTQLPERFDALVALELIEHLENPHHFMRECFAMLRPGGTMVVSTPNLANPVSQAMFVREGVFQWYRDEDYREQGHISPIAPVVLRRCWTEAGFALQWEGSVSNAWRRVRKLRTAGTFALASLIALASGTPRALRGEVYLALLRKPAS